MKLPHLFRKANPAMRAVLAYFGWAKEIPKKKDYAALTEAGYLNCAMVFACVKYIAQAGSRISWVLGKKKMKGGLEEIEEHPLLKMLRRPNEAESGTRLMEKGISHLMLNGNSYITKMHGAASAPPVFLYALRPDRMTIEKGNWMMPVAGYTYKAGTEKESFKFQDVLHLTEFHPLDDWYGLSRLEVAARQVDILNKASEWNKRLLDNDMKPPAIIKAKYVSDDTINQVRKQFKENFEGYENAGLPVLIGGDELEWTDISLKPKDMDWLNSKKMTMRELCAIFNLCSELFGDSENKTYSNMKEAHRAAYTEAVLPVMDIFRDEFNYWLVPLFGDGLYLDYDRDKIEALQEDREKKYGYLMGANWLKVNEKRVACGYDEVPEGNVILVSLSDIALGSEIPSAPTDEDKGTRGRLLLKAGGTGFWRDPQRKERLWMSHKARVETRERSFLPAAEKYLKRQKEAIVAAISKNQFINGISADSIFDKEAEIGLYAKAFEAWYKDHFIRAGNAGMRAVKGELFDDGEFKAEDLKKPSTWVFNMTTAREEALMQMVFNSGTKVNEMVIDRIYDLLNTAQVENWPVYKLAQFIKDEASWFSYWRARNWARTESTKIDNFGQVEGFKATEFVEKKGWLCMFVEDSREAHMKADGQEVLVNDDFDIAGEKLAYPGDPRGKAENVCQCLCDVYPVV